MATWWNTYVDLDHSNAHRFVRDVAFGVPGALKSLTIMASNPHLSYYAVCIHALARVRLTERASPLCLNLTARPTARPLAAAESARI